MAVLATAGCASKTKTTDAPAGPAVTGKIDPVAGCENAWTDPADRSPTRKAARCKPGFPEPQPLQERTKFVIALTTKSAELQGPMYWAQAKGEFAKENLDVEIKIVPPADALSLLASGQLDAWQSGPDASFHNALNQGYDLRWVAGNYSEAPESKSGLWAVGKNDMSKLRGGKVGSAAGIGSTILLPISQALAKGGLTVKDVTFQTLKPSEQLTALENGAIDAAWLLTPAWNQVVDRPTYNFLGGQPPGEPLGGLIYGPKLLREHRDVGVAFMRAYFRTISTYFTGDYKADANFLNELAPLLDLKPETLKSTPPLVFDWEIRAGTSKAMQEVWLQTGAIRYATPLPEERVVDRSLYQLVVGHQG
ncbi:ABC transporter substrate-binding protein [Dactylosporangium sucinum]|uniref:Nitrate ABC transporter substrate-binding protein n=1 Tax=Dactylosporangium sucinum TaxID=1424081 RepID=A0A917TWF9_9ACTN|nr:ABC transporter substrate-binding protein [Dactylosporangium sucinum]GGM38925.1 nitrate ABC transporter substrate-binding protein [Dactylosporangium sucinum]